VNQARQSYNNDFYNDQQDNVISSGYQPWKGGVMPGDLPDARNAQPLFPQRTPPAGTNPATQAEAVRQMDKLLAAVTDVVMGQGGTEFAERLAGKLRRDAEQERHTMQEAMQSSYATALTKVETLGHLYRLLGSLVSTHNTPPVVQDYYAVQTIYGQARSEFRKRWGDAQ
jgi:hypothetical protein